MFKTIRIFTEAFDVIQEYKPEALTKLSGDVVGEIEHMNDFEGFRFIVIDSKTVVTIDGISGDVIDNESMDNFISNTIQFAGLNVENY